MKKRSKRYQEALKKLDQSKVYSPEEGLAFIKENSGTKFDSSVEVHLHLGIDPKAADQIVRGVVLLPHGTGQTKKVVAFVTPDLIEEAKKAGADIIGDEDLISTIRTTGRCDFDIAIAIPAMMKKLGPIARTLGQKGLMPNPKTDTITTNIQKTIEEIKRGKATYRSDDSGNVHQIIGKFSFDQTKLLENFESFMESIRKARPASLKGTYIQSLFLSSTMGPSIPIKA